MSWIPETVGGVCLPTPFRNPRLEPAIEFEYIDISGVDRERKAIASTQRILGSEAPSRARKEIAAGDVLVSTVRPNLNAVALVPEELDGAIASTGFCVLRSNRRAILPRFLFFFSRSAPFIESLATRVRGANYPAVTDSDVRAVQLCLPSLPEQGRIVEMLDQADRLRKLRTEADAKMERIAFSFFVELFGQPAASPERWPLIELGKAVTHLTSGARNWSQFTGNGSAGFLRTQDIVDGEIAPEMLSIDPPKGAEAARTRLSPGDVAVTITGIVGKAAVFEDCHREVYVSQHVALVRLKREILLPHYFVAYANLPSGPTPTLARFQYGQTKPGLGFRELKKAVIPRPPVEVQAKFTEGSLAIADLRRRSRASRKTIERLWQTLLHRAFTGDLTASWREAHMKELLQEMENQEKALASLGADR